MSFAREKLFNGYVRTKMPVFASNVKCNEIVPHLPCLTLSDREEIAAKRDYRGNFDAMLHLLDCLRRRENWPEEFIAALRACEHLSMAAEMEAEYSRLKAPGAPKPPTTAPSTVVTVTVHSPPPVGQPASSSLRETPEEPGATQSPVSSEQRGARTPPDPREPSTPPPLEATLLAPQAPVPARQEPEENSEEELEEFVGIAGGSGVTGAIGRDGREVTAATGSAAEPEVTEIWRSSDPGEPPGVCGVDSSEDLSSESVTLTPEKVPVQDSEPLRLSEPPQVKRSLQPAAAAAWVPAPVEAAWGRLDHLEPVPAQCRDLEDDPCLSKPGELLSVQPGAAQHATLPNTVRLEPSFSGNVSLQISDPEPERSGTHPPFSGNDISLQISDPEIECSGTRPQGSGPGRTQESPYASYDLASFAEQEVLEHVGHVTEEPSIQNLASPVQGILGNAVHVSQEQHWDGRNEGHSKVVVQNPPGGEGGEGPQVLNGKAMPALAHEQVPALHQHSGAKLQDEPEKELASVSTLPRTKYVMTAAGMAVCAMFVAWRLKN